MHITKAKETAERMAIAIATVDLPGGGNFGPSSIGFWELIWWGSDIEDGE